MKKGDRWAALEPVRQGVRADMGGFGKSTALGLGLRHDWGSQYRARQFQAEIKWLGIRLHARLRGRAVHMLPQTVLTRIRLVTARQPTVRFRIQLASTHH